MDVLESSWLPSEWVLALLIIVVGLYLYGTWSYGHFKKRGIPYLKPSWPFVGNWGPTLFGRVSFTDQVRSVYKKMKGQKYMGIFIFGEPVIWIRDPDLIKMVAVKEFDHFMNHRTTFSEKLDPFFTKNLFSLKDQRWRDMRSTLSPAFTSSKMKNMFLLVSECGVQMAEYLQNRCHQIKDGGPDQMLTLEMKDFFTRFATDVIATAAFGVSCDSLETPQNEFFVRGKDLTNFGGIKNLILFGYLMMPKIMEMLRISMVSNKSKNFFRSLVHGTIATRERERIVRPDMIHLLMQARKGELKADAEESKVNNGVYKETKTRLEDDDITAQAVIFFFAGFETVSTLMCFSTYLLAIHPDIQQRLQDEIDTVLEESGNKLTYEGMQKMKYLDMVISESLRLYSPLAGIDRMCVAPFTVHASDTHPELHLKKGDMLWFPAAGLHHDPEFFPDPDKFDPERFSDENKHKINPFTYLPFGLGPRLCIGQRFAMMEVKIALVNLLSHFSLHVEDKTPIPMQLKRTGFNVTAEAGFWTGINPRNQ